ncbi:MAG: hypothetical protein IPN40_04295 [Uliginosibacterium sp.]|nr:hypothetical protein [Uliginosibacterium sp.]
MRWLLVCLILAGCGPTAEDRKIKELEKAAARACYIHLNATAGGFQDYYDAQRLGASPDMWKITLTEKSGRMLFCRVTDGTVGSVAAAGSFSPVDTDIQVKRRAGQRRNFEG